jgi:enamine deaminase RidA (YjgF/YER057c/UK114 family)
MIVRHVNPEGMLRNPAFSQAVVVESPNKTIYVGGQNGVDAEGKVVADNLRDQSRQAFRNIATVLEAEGATLANIVSWTIAVTAGQPILEGVAAFQEVWDPSAPPPAITVLVVAEFANPQFLVEINAIAVA